VGALIVFIGFLYYDNIGCVINLNMLTNQVVMELLMLRGVVI